MRRRRRASSEVEKEEGKCWAMVPYTPRRCLEEEIPSSKKPTILAAISTVLANGGSRVVSATKQLQVIFFSICYRMYCEILHFFFTISSHHQRTQHSFCESKLMCTVVNYPHTYEYKKCTVYFGGETKGLGNLQNCFEHVLSVFSVFLMLYLLHLFLDAVPICQWTSKSPVAW